MRFQNKKIYLMTLNLHPSIIFEILCYFQANTLLAYYSLKCIIICFIEALPQQFSFTHIVILCLQSSGTIQSWIEVDDEYMEYVRNWAVLSLENHQLSNATVSKLPNLDLSKMILYFSGDKSVSCPRGRYYLYHSKLFTI